MASKIVNILLILIGTLGITLFMIKGAVAFMTLTYEGFQSKLILKHFSIKKIETEEAKLTLFLKFGLYFALFAIALKVLKWILSIFDLFKNYTATLQRILSNSYDYFIIFALLLFYLLQSKTGWGIKEKVPLFGFWFISGRVIYAIGYLLTTLTGLNLKVPGVAMIYALISLMVAQALDVNGFNVFKILDPLVPEL